MYRFGVAVCVATLVAAPLVATDRQAAVGITFDEIVGYRLTPAVFRQWTRAVNLIFEATVKDPRGARGVRLRKEADTLLRKGDYDGLRAAWDQLDTLGVDRDALFWDWTALPSRDAIVQATEMVARLERETRLATSLRTANLTPTEFVKFSMKLHVTSLALEFAKFTSEGVTGREVSAQDIELFRQNEKEIRALLKRIRGL